MITDVSQSDTHLILIGDAIQANQCLVLAEIYGLSGSIEIGLWENELLEFHEL